MNHPKTALVWIILLALACSACARGDFSSDRPGPATVWASAGPAAAGVTYHVRTDGGTPDQCTGLVNAPYPGSGTAQPCAWDHPFRALPPGDSPHIAGGDTLSIGPGEYQMGYGAPGADGCEADYPWDCSMPPIPAGPDPAHPTRILGAGWDVGCPQPPELWGTGRAAQILNLTGSDNVEVACLEITDRESCVEDHTGGLACARDQPPYGDWAAIGLYAEDAANVHLAYLDIHGLAHTGILAGRLADWTVEHVRLAGNGWAGWDGDIDGDDGNTGTMLFRHWTVEWNGCGETYPGGQPTGCWSQTAGGYGDGVGTGLTAGQWIIEDSTFAHNTSDGLDLLYVREPGSSIEIRRSAAWGNAGDQFKTHGPTSVENSVAVSQCGFFQGKPFTYDVDPCRSGGSALAFTLRPGDQATATNVTLAGQGDCLVIAECAEGEQCQGGEEVRLRNGIFLGYPEFGSDDTACLAWYGTTDDPFVIDYAIVSGVKELPDSCPTGSLCGASPGLLDEQLDTLDAHLRADSPAVNAGTSENAPMDDIEGHARDAQPDIGAYEWVEVTPQAYLPVTQTNSPGGHLAVDDFMYQLQNMDLPAIGNTAYDLVVMDYAADGSDETAFTAAQIEALKHSPGGAKTVLAYMSIGEAEDYRFYWQDNWRPGVPSWLDQENPDWAGNYKVRYWDPGWQEIVFRYTDRLLSAGFDGAYLDIIDGYAYYADRGRSTAAQEMIDLVGAIRAYAHTQDPGFYIVTQNAPELAAWSPSYLEIVDGIGQEDIHYGYDGDDILTPPEVTAELESHLDLFARAGKLVMTVDYATTPAHIDDAYAKAYAKGYVPFCTVRDLDRLVINPGHEPD